MSEEGGLEEVEESLRVAASCWLSRATTSLRAASSASRASTRACNRRQLGQRTESLALIATNYTDSAAGPLPFNGKRLRPPAINETGHKERSSPPDPSKGYPPARTPVRQPFRATPAS